jgi:azurin
VNITFMVPPAGAYTYVCLFPGHANMMLGTFRALS